MARPGPTPTSPTPSAAVVRRRERPNGVTVGFVTLKARALLDRALYLPKDWAADTDRRTAAGVPKAVGFATSPVKVSLFAILAGGQ